MMFSKLIGFRIIYYRNLRTFYGNEIYNSVKQKTRNKNIYKQKMIKTLKQMPSLDTKSVLICNIRKRNALEFISKNKKFLHFEEIFRKISKKDFLYRPKRPIRAPKQSR